MENLPTSTKTQPTSKQKKKQMPRTEAERRQRIIALDDDYNQLCTRNPGYDTESINWLPGGQEILRQIKIMEELAGKLRNYIQITTEDKEMCTTSEDRLRTTTTGTTGEAEEEEVPSSSSMFNIGNEFTTCTTMPMIIDNDNNTSNTVMPTIIEDKSNHDEFTATINTIEKKSGNTTTTETDEVCHTIEHATVDNKFTTSTTTTEEDPLTTKTRPKTKPPPKMNTTGDDKGFPNLSGMFDIDNEFTTSNTTYILTIIYYTGCRETGMVRGFYFCT